MKRRAKTEVNWKRVAAELEISLRESEAECRKLKKESQRMFARAAQSEEFLRVLKFYEAQFETARQMLSVVPIPVNYGIKIADVNPVVGLFNSEKK